MPLHAHKRVGIEREGERGLNQSQIESAAGGSTGLFAGSRSSRSRRQQLAGIGVYSFVVPSTLCLFALRFRFCLLHLIYCVYRH